MVYKKLIVTNIGSLKHGNRIVSFGNQKLMPGCQAGNYFKKLALSPGEFCGADSLN